MARNEENLQAAERFIRETLERSFGQKLDKDTLRAAAEKICKAIPEPA